jgi:hypothetical protein
LDSVLVHINISQEHVKAMETCEADQYNEVLHHKKVFNFFGMKIEI